MAFAASWTIDEGDALRARLARLDRLSRLLDIAFVIPGTKIRFGVDAIIGIVPIVGSWIGVALSSLIVIEAVRLGVPMNVLARMIGNVAVEGAIGTVPIAGDIFDVFWRANRRNLALIIRHFEQDRRV